MSNRSGVAPRSFDGLKIGRVLGIPIIVHWSWLVSLGILSVYAHGVIVVDIARDASSLVQNLLSVGFGLVIAACILFHELAHCVVALAYGLPVRRITLFALGGVSQIEREVPGPAAEFHVAIAGPLSSLILATTLGTISRVLNPGTDILRGAWGGIAYVNFALAVFNLLPAFPLDGGRVLRSGLWGAVRSRARATRWAVTVGRTFASLLMGAGLIFVGLALLNGTQGDLGGAWWFLLGWFIYQAAGRAGAAEGGETPNAVQVTGIMPPPPARRPGPLDRP